MISKEFKTAYDMLNPEQKKAVDTVEGPVMVVAGPGTGKTQILTLRIANILKQTDTRPDNILALTFTEAGVHAMRKRLSEIIGSDAYNVNIYTFHGFCNDIIKTYPEEFPRIVSSSTVIEADQINIVENIIEHNTFEHIKPYGDPLYYIKALLGAIRDLKREGVTHEEFSTHALKQQKEFQAIPDLYYEKGAHAGKMKGKYKPIEKLINRNTELATVYRLYQEALEKRQLYDYEDMIMEVVSVLETNPEFLLILQEQYQYILADEHQDTNRAQNKILELLSNFHDDPNLFIVGDEKQAIYRFQGASLDNFLYFKELYPNVLLISLVNNYRSTQTILDSAHSLISNNSVSDPELRKELISNTPHENAHIDLCVFSKPEYEYQYLIHDIEKKIQSGVPSEEIAILYRNNKDAFEIIRFLEKTDIPFTVVSDQNVLGDITIVKLITLLRAINTLDDDHLLAEALHIDFLGLPALDVYKVVRYSVKEKVSLIECIGDTKCLSSAGVGEPDLFIELHHRILNWHAVSKNKTLLECLELTIRESGMLQHVLSVDNTVDMFAKLDGFYREAVKCAENHTEYTLRHFLEYIDVLNTYNVLIKNGGKLKSAGVRLMTAHKSKGQEFDHVYVVGCFDKHWGNKRTRKLFDVSMGDIVNEHEDKGDNDDERRLFYVALTRARKAVTISYPEEGLDGRSQLPSLFIEEIKPELVRTIDTASLEASFSKEKGFIFAPRSQKQDQGLKDTEYIQELFLERGFSVTSLNNYLRCPWAFFYNNLLRLPVPYSTAQMYGTSVHGALKDFFDAYIQKNGVPNKSILLQAFQGHLDKQILTKQQHAELLSKGEASLSNWYDTYKDSWHVPLKNEFRVTGVSIPITYEGEEKNILLNGNLDKIEVIEGQTVHVVDYKTGKPKTRNNIEGKTKDSRGDYKRQLVFYKMLLDLYDDGRYEMLSGELDFIEPDDKGECKKEIFEITPEEVEELKETITRSADEILSFSFWDKTCEDKDCQFCALRKLM